MASIVIDGPRDWAIDVLDRKLGRLFAAGTGLGMLAAVFIIHPGPARFALAAGSVVLIAQSTGFDPTRARRRSSLAVCPGPPVCSCPDVTNDLVELELAMLDLRKWGQDRAAHTAERLNVITGMVAEIVDQVR